jgi:glycosyltransferase involved in cell wall biosynthesis
LSGIKKLKIAFIVGTLGLGGAEKQLVYMIRALQQAGAQIRVYCLTRGEYYESALKEINLLPVWIGKNENPLYRLAELVTQLNEFRPYIIQSAHFYTNLYTSLSALFCGALGVGCLRSDAYNEVYGNGFWGMKLLKAPQAIIANSNTAKRNAIRLGARAKRIFVLPNVIDLEAFDQRQKYAVSSSNSLLFRKSISQINVAVVGNLITEKRFDRFLKALCKAREGTPTLCGFIAGDGEERNRLEQLSVDLGLVPDGVSFLGRIDNVPALLSQMDIFVLCSDNEGMPNVILEAMAAKLPIITTPAGDAGIAVEHGTTGYVVPFDDIDTLASYMVTLSSSAELRQKLGDAGRKRVEQFYSYDLLGTRLLDIYKEMENKYRGHGR